MKINAEAVLAIHVLCAAIPLIRNTKKTDQAYFYISYIFCASACVLIGQFTNNWTQTQLNQSVSSASSLHLVLARNGGAGATTSGYQAPTVGQNNTATGGASFAQHTQNPKINASAKGFGASQPAYRVSKT